MNRPELPHLEERQITYRPMVRADVGSVPDDCHGSREELLARIDDLGAAAILAYDGGQHVGQLQVRRFAREQRSPKGIWHPDYWGDFGDEAPTMPEATLAIHCYHVGQLTQGEERDARYFGRGIGEALLDHLLAWAEEGGYEAVVAKHTPRDRAVMGFMGGQPAGVYEERGFETQASWIDVQLHGAILDRNLVEKGADPGTVARVGLCVKRW